ncbi:MAG: type 2 lanthipeptide synthetase LanM family protein [Dehalococcoidia bacterium]
MVTEQELSQIAGRAASLSERLEGAGWFAEPAPSAHRAERSMERWRQLVARGDDKRFRQRLARDGLDQETVHHALGPGQFPAERPLLDWTHTIRAVLEFAPTLEAARGDACSLEDQRILDPQRPLPFAEILLPFIALARRRLTSRTGSAHRLLASAAHASLERSLLQRLAGLCAPSLQLEFSALRAAQQSSLLRLLGQPPAIPSTDRYNRFARSMLTNGLPSFFREYPVLARLSATVVDQWVATVTEFLLHLERDWPQIGARFLPGHDLGAVTALSPALSDPHQGGRSVIAITFAAGLKLVYKPKEIGLERIYAALLDWLNRHGAPLSLRSPRLLERSGYGWIEFVEQRPCLSEAEVERFYRRAGMLLCLCYALGGSDFHHENLIAAGEHPVVVDLETLVQPELPPAEMPEPGAEALLLADRMVQDSVLAGGLLPMWMIGPKGRGVDASGLGGVGDQEGIYREPRWDAINSDQMQIQAEYGVLRAGQNTVRLNGAVVPPTPYVEQIADGFRALYLLLLDHREALLAPDGPLRALADQRIRFIFRPTQLYARLFRSALEGRALEDGAAYSIELDILSRPLLDADESNRFWPLRRLEQEALEQLDIPFFTTPATSDSLELAPDQVIQHCFLRSASDRAVARVAGLSIGDLERQLAFIRASLALRADTAHSYGHSGDVAASARTRAVFPAIDSAAPTGADVPAMQRELISHALAIAAALERQAIRADDGSVCWIGVTHAAGLEPAQIRRLGYDLYGGLSGIALFLAALEHVTGGAGYRELALGAARPVSVELRNRAGLLAGLIGIGAAGGCGGLVYALVCIARLLGEPALIEEAGRAAATITPARIREDRSLDVVSGAAGAILGLLALQRTAASPQILDQAAACGRHLLLHRFVAASGQRTWITLRDEPLSGFSHGAAGIAYALLRLSEATGEREFLDAAAEGVAWEASLFVPEAGNWLDRRQPAADGHPAFMAGWCHGAPGIGLARLGSLPQLDALQLRQEIEAALRTTEEAGLRGVDILCCGSCARIEFLLEAARRLQRPDLLRKVRTQARSMATRAMQESGYRLPISLPEGICSPGLFTGNRRDRL